MINLLPFEEKERLLSEKKQKIAAILGFVVSVALICFTLILLAIKFYLLVDTEYQENLLKQMEKENQTADYLQLNDTVKKYNEALVKLDSFYKKEIYFNDILDVIVNIPSPNGLFLENISFIRDDKGVIKATILGISDTREHLITFKKNVENCQSQKWPQGFIISNVIFSPESWVSPKGANFSLSFEIKKSI